MFLNYNILTRDKNMRLSFKYVVNKEQKEITKKFIKRKNRWKLKYNILIKTPKLFLSFGA